MCSQLFDLLYSKFGGGERTVKSLLRVQTVLQRAYLLYFLPKYNLTGLVSPFPTIFLSNVPTHIFERSENNVQSIVGRFYL